MKRLFIITSFLMISIFLVGCGADEEKELVEEVIENIEFKKDKQYFYSNRVHIDTKNQTHVWGASITSWIEAGEEESKISYTKDSFGEISDRKIYLGEEDLKKYSKSYAKKFGETLNTVKE